MNPYIKPQTGVYFFSGQLQLLQLSDTGESYSEEETPIVLNPNQ